MGVDVVLITYNHEKYIAQALESILMQELNMPIRVIVADDASGDATLEIIKSYEEKSPFPFVYTESTANVGLTRNYQKAFSLCNAEYVAILEGDDYWCSPYHLKQHLDFLYEHRECSMSINRRYVLHPHSYMDLAIWNRTEDYRLVSVHEQCQENKLGNLSSCVLRNKFIQEFPADLYSMFVADYMIGIMMSRCGLVAVLKNPTSVYRNLSEGAWTSKSEKEKTEDLLKRSRLYDEFLKFEYHNDFVILQNRLMGKHKFSIRDLVPKFLVDLCKWVFPPIILNQLKRK